MLNCAGIGTISAVPLPTTLPLFDTGLVVRGLLCDAPRGRWQRPSSVPTLQSKQLPPLHSFSSTSNVLRNPNRGPLFYFKQAVETGRLVGLFHFGGGAAWAEKRVGQPLGETFVGLPYRFVHGRKGGS